MSVLARLRLDLDFMPSPAEERPGLLIRDPFQFSGATLIIPPPLIPCLELFDGAHTALDLREQLVRITGELDVSEVAAQVTEALSSAGFLQDAVFAQIQDEAHRGFAEAPVRESVHAGGGYPDEPGELRSVLANYMGDPPAHNGTRTLAIAAPHVSPFGGWECYKAAYNALNPADADRTFVILGTSHYGEPDRFGLTRKPFVTPYGSTATATDLIDELEKQAPAAVTKEDYCHAVEHSIEFQVIFLQHLFGPKVRILPILCGSFGRSIYAGKMPESEPQVARFIGALGQIAAREGDKLCWVLGVDMAHMGKRYGDPHAALAEREEMLEVSERDQSRIASLNSGDAHGFWQQISENQDDLRWCGSAPLYTFMKALPQARGSLLRYQQWNIDPNSVVSFAGIKFTE